MTAAARAALKSQPQQPDPAPVEDPPLVLSAGQEADLRLYGFCIDPVTGRQITNADPPAGS